jgi:hypothetical protein
MAKGLLQRLPDNYRAASLQHGGRRCGNCAYGLFGGNACTMFYDRVSPNMVCNSWVKANGRDRR